MVSYFVQKDTYDYGKTSYDGGRIGDARDLARSVLQYERESVFELEATAREERCADSELETARLGGKIDALKVVVMKVEGERDENKGLVEMMARDKTALHRRRDDPSTEGEGNRTEIAGLRFRLEEAETR